MKPITLDFETLPIEDRPRYPPEPVSFSLQLPTWRTPKFFAWGHRSGGNTCTKDDAARILKDVYSRVSLKTPLLCHNAKFDLDVAHVHFGLELPHWSHWHDTMFLIFLQDPHQRALGLKPSADRLLGMPPDEQDAVKDWILANKRALEAQFPEIITRYGGVKPSTAGAFIAYAPAKLVEPYANGDVVRAAKLFGLVYPEIIDRGMSDAYDRERQLMPILLRNETEGVRVDVGRMESDQTTFEAAQKRADAWLRKALKSPVLDLDKDAEMAAALKKADAVSEWTQTATGRDSVARKNLKLSHFRDRKVAAAYAYRQKCATVLETFIRPWLGYQSNGHLHTSWNQVRQTKGGMGDTGGTRTGRPSTDSPNFLNMPKTIKDSEVGGFIMPTHIAGLPELPRIRRYILPDEKGHVIGRRDINQQELRVLAHFEDGALMQAYLANPRLDVHEFTRLAILELTGLDVGRPFTKTLMFGYVYGEGLGSLAERLERTVEEVQAVRNAQMSVLPGLKALSNSLKQLAREGRPLRTWGGREYYCEPPKEIQGRMRTFEYKLLNYLVQGSSADITKEWIIRYDATRRDGRFMLSVYDENNISMPKKAAKSEMLILREAVVGLELDVPLLSDGELGPTLGDVESFKEPAPNLTKWSQ